MKGPYSGTSFYALAIAAALIPATAYANDSEAQPATASAQGGSTQDGQGPADLDPGEIVVTAQKREESINSVPLSITAVSGDDLTARGITDAASLSKAVPGFIATQTYFGSPVYYLRGVGFYDTAMAAKPAVTMYADEAPIPFAVMALGTTLDLERVEVLKGPQGTLFGSNSTGGAINFIAAKPTRELDMGAGLSYGRFNEILANGFVSGPLGDSIAARIAVSHQGMDDWQHSYTNDSTHGSKNITSGRLTLDIDPSPDVRMRFTLSGTKDRSDMQAPQLVGKDLALSLIQPGFLAYPLAPDNSRAADFSATYPNGLTLQRDDWVWQASGRIDIDATPDLTFTSLTSYLKAGQEHGYDSDGTTLTLTSLSLYGKLRSITQEFRAAGKLGDAGTFILGVNYENDKTSEFTIFDIRDSRSGHVFDGLGLPPTDSVPQIADQDSETYAAFANLDYNLTPTLTARAGVRFTQSTTDFAACAQAGGNLTYATGMARALGVPVPASGQCATFIPQPGGGYAAGLVLNSLDEQNISWRAGLDWKITPDTMIYGVVSRGFKAGAFSNISAVFADQYRPVPQEKLTAYELGIKTDILGNLGHFNGALFYYDYLNKQLLGTAVVPVFNTLTALVSIPKSHVEGAEADLVVRPAQGLSLRAAATYVKTRVDTHFIGNTTFGPRADFYGQEFPNTPNWQANGGARYEWRMGGFNAFVNLDVNYRGSAQSDFIPDERLFIKAYTILDAQIGLETEDGKWRFQVWGRNLTNENYATTLVRRQEAIVRTTGLPVMYGASLSWRY